MSLAVKLGHTHAPPRPYGGECSRRTKAAYGRVSTPQWFLTIQGIFAYLNYERKAMANNLVGGYLSKR